MTTLTGSLAVTGIMPKLTHEGVNAIYGQYAIGADGQTVSAGDVIYLAKLQHGATVLDGWVKTGGEQYGTAIGLEGGGLGTADPDKFLATATLSAGATRLNLAMPFTLSLSDGATTRYSYFCADIENDVSTTSTLTFCFLVTGD